MSHSTDGIVSSSNFCDPQLANFSHSHTHAPPSATCREGNEVFLSDSEATAFAHEYAKLASCEVRSEAVEARIDAILEMAVHNDLLSAKIAEVDYQLGSMLNLLTPDAQHSYRNQQAFLQEHLGDPDCIVPKEKQIKSYQQPQDPTLYRNYTLLNGDDLDEQGQPERTRIYDCVHQDNS
jgi:hypothetical protein